MIQSPPRAGFFAPSGARIVAKKAAIFFCEISCNPLIRFRKHRTFLRPR
nr:MAG TPA: protease [Caudoviricetes sp.]